MQKLQGRVRYICLNTDNFLLRMLPFMLGGYYTAGRERNQDVISTSCENAWRHLGVTEQDAACLLYTSDAADE